MWRHALPQGLLGHHALFEPELVRFTMRRRQGPPLRSSDLLRLQSLMQAVESSQDTDERRDWIAGAPLPVQEALIRAYFGTLFDYLDQRTPLAN